MKTKLNLSALTTLVAIGLLFSCSEKNEVKQQANNAQSQEVDRTILPLPDPEFKGTIEKTLDASMPDWPEAVKPPKGAPNVLIIMGDDVGFGHAGLVWRTGKHTEL